MPIEDALRKYPICDTDIWIKMCKLDMEQDLFDEYCKLFFADAVVQELKNKAKDSPEDLKCGIDNYTINLDNILDMSIDGKYFNSKQRKIARKLFAQNNIIHINGEFKDREKHLGEKVSLIYASIHNLDVMLSDDTESKEYSRYIRNRFKTVKVINALDFMKIRGIPENQAKELRSVASTYLDKKEADIGVVNGRVKDLKHLKYGLAKKNLI